ncbi:KH domain-containing protein [Apostasia shenzhenica]|uniref:KH domain-containing protein n=1 Tax=Apostasia shenzhenica TaxID=1088818 RepID=A0A2I0AJG9_9ASPA|nr:KH domain-containing protein [Apostasia shenzhenica]
MDGEGNFYRKRSHDYSDNEVNKRRNINDKREIQGLKGEQTEYRYLCPRRKVGLIMGVGGEIVKHIRADSGAYVEIQDTIQGCEERIVKIYSSSKGINRFRDMKGFVCPAQNALFKVHERLVKCELPVSNDDGDGIDMVQVTARLLITSDQARCIIGKGGHSIKSMRYDTGAKIGIWSDDRLPACANRYEELLEIKGQNLAVKEALFRVSCLLHELPPRSLAKSSATDPSVGYIVHNQEHDLQGRNYEFSLRMICPSINIREVIGKGGDTINQIRQESGASVKLDCFFDEDDCMILVSANEFSGNSCSPTINAAIQLQPRCSKKIENEFGKPSYVTRLLIPRSRVGCLIGKSGVVIKEMRRATHASISIVEESLPSVASEDDAMVEISGDLMNARDALIEVIGRLKSNISARRGSLPSSSSSAPSSYMPRNTTYGSVFTGRNCEQSNHGYIYGSTNGDSPGKFPSELHGCSEGDGYN